MISNTPYGALQQLQMPRHIINHALRPQDTEHCPTPTRNLRPSSILNHTRAETKANRLRLEQLQLVLTLNL